MSQRDPFDTERAIDEQLARWSDDPEPTPCKWCDSEGVVHVIGGSTQPCDECGGDGVREDSVMLAERLAQKREDWTQRVGYDPRFDDPTYPEHGGRYE